MSYMSYDDERLMIGWKKTLGCDPFCRDCEGTGSVKVASKAPHRMDLSPPVEDTWIPCYVCIDPPHYCDVCDESLAWCESRIDFKDVGDKFCGLECALNYILGDKPGMLLTWIEECEKSARDLTEDGDPRLAAMRMIRTDVIRLARDNEASRHREAVIEIEKLAERAF